MTGCGPKGGGGRGRGIALLFQDPAALYPWERPGTHCTGGWVGLRAGLDGRKISPPPGFDTRTAQPVVNR
jgi:hypothetical protein